MPRVTWAPGEWRVESRPWRGPRHALAAPPRSWQPSGSLRRGEWLDLCRKGDAEVGDPDTDPTLRRFFPGHREWVWCVRNYFAALT